GYSRLRRRRRLDVPVPPARDAPRRGDRRSGGGERSVRAGRRCRRHEARRDPARSDVRRADRRRAAGRGARRARDHPVGTPTRRRRPGARRSGRRVHRQGRGPRRPPRRRPWL
ncbi:MAG: hypothetical protein AVDCRST_MAG85-3178, partial [uncultured Solirubrobacteraceae bacterium]